MKDWYDSGIANNKQQSLPRLRRCGAFKLIISVCLHAYFSVKSENLIHLNILLQITLRGTQRREGLLII